MFELKRKSWTSLFELKYIVLCLLWTNAWIDFSPIQGLSVDQLTTVTQVVVSVMGISDMLHHNTEDSPSSGLLEIKKNRWFILFYLLRLKQSITLYTVIYWKYIYWDLFTPTTKPTFFKWCPGYIYVLHKLYFEQFSVEHCNKMSFIGIGNLQEPTTLKIKYILLSNIIVDKLFFSPAMKIERTRK